MMNNIFVYCEIENGKIADVSLELLTKGRGLAAQLGCKVEALAIGSKLSGIERTTLRYWDEIGLFCPASPEKERP